MRLSKRLLRGEDYEVALVPPSVYHNRNGLAFEQAGFVHLVTLGDNQAQIALEDIPVLIGWLQDAIEDAEII